MQLCKDWTKALVSLAAALCTIGFGPGDLTAATAERQSAKPKKAQPDENLFKSNKVFRIQIEISEPDIKRLRESPRGMGEEQERTSVKAVVHEGGKVYKDVALHLKGAAGSFRGIDDRPSLTLNFDKYVKGQTFHGIERFSLNNSVQDRSLLNEKISRELFEAAGIPVPRATHAKVELNGRDLGIYVLAEAYNKQFLTRHFASANGNLYDGGLLRDITDELEKSSGGKPDDRSELKRLAEAAKESDLTSRLRRMEELLDLERFITYLALDIMLCDSDGYALNRNNYRVYYDPGSGKITFMPHGMDQMFGTFRTGPDMPLFPRMQGLVASAVMQTPEGRRRYREQVSKLLANVFQAPRITNRVTQVAATLEPFLAETGAGRVRAHKQEVTALCARIMSRADSIRAQLDEPTKSLEFDAKGAARFTEWTPRAEHGKPVLQETAEAGKTLFLIKANGSSVGVWTTRVRLEPGRYRLEAKAKTQGVVADPGDRRAGAGLRVTGQRFPQKVLGNSDWQVVAVEFDFGGQAAAGFMGPIQSDMPEIELMCELRAAKGQAWFDRDSIRLIRR